MGRRKERSGFGRRQVLQLNDSKREGSPYRGQGGQWPVRNEGNALSGLMAHYGESDVSEEEEEETPPHVPEEPPPEEPVQPVEPPVAPEITKENGHRKEPENKGNVSLDIDSKVANFLAEIDALDTDRPDDIDGEPMQDVEMEDAMVEPPPPPPEEESPDNKSESQSESEESEDSVEEAPEPPAAPVTVWQHCQDENTQYYYYWNTTTNEVTWEIPLEYSQYLLQLKEHDEALTRYEAKKAEYEAKLNEAKLNATKKSKKKSSKEQKPSVEKGMSVAASKEDEPPPHRVEKKDIKPWLLKKIRETYGDKYNTSDTEEEKPPLPAEPEAPAEIGPQLPPSMIAEETRPEIGPQLPPGHLMEESDDLMEGPLPDKSYNVSLPTEHQDFAANLGTVPNGEVSPIIGPMPLEDEESGGLLASREYDAKTSSEELSNKPIYDSESDDNSEDSKNTVSEANTFIGPQLPVSIVEKKEDTQVEREEEVEEEEEEEEEEDLDFIDKQLEEPYMAMRDKKKTVKKEPEFQPSIVSTPATVTRAEEEEEEEDVEFDIDDIDQQLDMALEKKTAEQRTDKETSSSSSKRKISNDPNETDKKRSKLTNGTSEEPTTPKKKIDKEEIKMKAEIADLSTLITDKLEFLEVTRKGLSKLQILLVETETRITDWREGALTTRYLLGRLQDAELQLQQYESSAAPPGWACHWDRTYKRYFYFHTTTGASQWDYPEDDGSKDLGKADVPSSTLPDQTVLSSSKQEAVSSSQADGDIDVAGAKDAVLPQYAQVDSTTFSTDTSQAAATLVSSSVPSNQTSTSGETSSASSEGIPGSKPSFPVDPSLFQDLFAPAPPPPSEPPPPGVEAAPPAVGHPRPPPGLPNSIPLSRSPPPPPPGTTPPHAATTTTAAEDSEPSEVASIDPKTTSLLAAAPPPPPPPEDVTTSTINQSSDQYNYSSTTVGSSYISNLPSGAPLPIPHTTANTSTIIAQPVISSMPAVSSSSTTTVAPPTQYMLNQPGSAQCTPPDTPPQAAHASYDTALDGVPIAEPLPPQQTTSALSSTQQQAKEKRRKKEKKSSMGLSLKKKKLPSLVAKWQEVHEAVEREVSKHNKEDSP